MFSEEILLLRGRLAAELTSQKFTIATAESCTGGLIGAILTHAGGASVFFKGGIIAYDNSIKETILSVPKEILVTYGAVSPQTVVSMALGATKLLQTDCAIAVSGIAGPDGGTLQKPIGTVCIAVLCPRHSIEQPFLFEGDRESIRLQTAIKAFTMMHSILRLA